MNVSPIMYRKIMSNAYYDMLESTTIDDYSRTKLQLKQRIKPIFREDVCILRSLMFSDKLFIKLKNYVNKHGIIIDINDLNYRKIFPLYFQFSLFCLKYRMFKNKLLLMEIKSPFL